MRQISKVYMLAVAMSAMAYRQEAVVEGQTGQAAAPAATPVATSTVKSPEELAAEAQANAELHTKIKANFNNKVDVLDTSFHFRKVKDPDTKIETKRATVTLPIPSLSLEGIVDILENGSPKAQELLLEACRAVILDAAREKINEDENISAANFPYEILGWDFIANLPKAERRGGGIAKELWDDFAADYIAIMPGITGKTKESVELAAKVFTTKFANAKTNKPVLKLLEQQLGIYINNTTQGEQFAPVVEWLSNKLETLQSTDETSLLLNL
jgi:hypothetical protein